MKKVDLLQSAVLIPLILAIAYPSLAISIPSQDTREVIVHVELPPGIQQEGVDISLSFLKESIPRSYRVYGISGRMVILGGPQEALRLLEGAGLKIIRVSRELSGLSEEGEMGAGSRSSPPPWLPLTFLGDVIDVDDIDGDGKGEIVVGTNNAEGKAGSVYVYSWEGLLQGRWSSPTAGIYDIDSRDLDNDGTAELIVQLWNGNGFHVLSHTAHLEWSGTVRYNVADISYNDLNDDGDLELVVFSRDSADSRGQITVFDPISHEALGVRSYRSADLKNGASVCSADFTDLNGDGIKEIIPRTDYLNRKMEILSSDCSLLHTEYFSMDVVYMNSQHDFNGDGACDITVLTSDRSSVKLHSFIGFNGSSFSTVWIYPQGAETLAKEHVAWDMTGSGMAF